MISCHHLETTGQRCYIRLFQSLRHHPPSSTAGKAKTPWHKGDIQSWITQFLQDRTQGVVTVDGESSGRVHVASGVPQGTVLGPLLFLCYINDLRLHIDSHIRLFADDCLLYRTIRNHGDHLLLQKDLDALTLWTKTWGMSFNTNKCYILTMNKSPITLQPFFYQLNNTILK